MTYVFLAYLYFAFAHLLVVCIVLGTAGAVVLGITCAIESDDEQTCKTPRRFPGAFKWVRGCVFTAVIALGLKAFFPGPSTIVKIVAVGSVIAIYQGNAEAFNSIPPKLLKLAESYIDKAQAATDPNQKGK